MKMIQRIRGIDMKLLLYCTKAKPYLFESYITKGKYMLENNEWFKELNGKIVAECDYEVEEIIITERGDYNYDCFSSPEYCTNTLSEEELCEKSCLYLDDIEEYLHLENGYAIHIKNLHIFDEPKELSDYYTFNGIVNNVNNWKPIDKAPQNMMYAYDLISELGFIGTYNMYLKKNTLISIKPEWLCKILNGEKTIEVRKKVLKEMLKNEITR